MTGPGVSNLGVVAAFGVGFLVAGQSMINGELGRRLGDPAMAAVASFGGGFVILLVLLAVVPALRRATRDVVAAFAHSLTPAGRRDPVHPSAWTFLGGLAGGIFVLVQSATVPLLGVAVFTVAVVAGQVSAGLGVDTIGLGPAGRQPVSRVRLAGAVLAVVAVVVSVADEWGRAGHLALAVLPGLAGGLAAFQQALNARVSRLVGGGSSGAIAAAVTNFAIGSAGLVAVAAAHTAIVGWPDRWPSQWWLYLGGLAGVAFVALGALIVSAIGVFMFGLGVVAGQLTGSLLLDLVAAAGQPVTVWVVTGTVLALVAAVGTATLSRVRRTPDG